MDRLVGNFYSLRLVGSLFLKKSYIKFNKIANSSPVAIPNFNNAVTWFIVAVLLSRFVKKFYKIN